MNTIVKSRLARVAAAAVCSAVIVDAGAQQGDVMVTQRCLTVHANQEWRPTGIYVDPGEFVCVAGAGLWSHGVQGEQAIIPYYGPEGYGKGSLVDGPRALLHVGALVGRIGSNYPFLIREQTCFVPRAGGALLLSMDDASSSMHRKIP